jgi:uroporphyrinogen-III synthase
MKQLLINLSIALPESRQLDVLADLFEKRGASIMRCPLVSIHDSPRIQEVETWLQSFIAQPPDYFLILTGEGIYRLTDFAERMGLKSQWQTALSSVYKLARGPKPNRALKLLNLQADLLAEQPTTDGMILSLERLNLTGKRVAVQLYGEDPNEKLQAYLQYKNIDYTTVAPYIYASDTETDKVITLVERLADKQIDVICFTSKAQYQRLVQVADKFSLQALLEQGLRQTIIAAVGPVVAEQLQLAGFAVDVMPTDKYFMKPMVAAVEKWALKRAI